MNTLLDAFRKWGRRKTCDPPAMEELHDCSDIMRIYAQRIKCSRSGPTDDLRTLFVQLFSEFDNTLMDTDTPVLTIRDKNVHFRPLQVEPGCHRDSQHAAFSTLARHWTMSADGFDTVFVDLTQSTPELIKRIMHGVEVADVIRGIRIWETLPCRISRIIVFKPTKMRILWMISKSLARLLPSKVKQKLSFTDQPYNPVSDQGNLKVHSDPVDVHVDHAPQMDVSAGQESFEVAVQVDGSLVEPGTSTLSETDTLHRDACHMGSF